MNVRNHARPGRVLLLALVLADPLRPGHGRVGRGDHDRGTFRSASVGDGRCSDHSRQAAPGFAGYSSRRDPRRRCRRDRLPRTTITFSDVVFLTSKSASTETRWQDFVRVNPRPTYARSSPVAGASRSQSQPGDERRPRHPDRQGKAVGVSSITVTPSASAGHPGPCGDIYTVTTPPGSVTVGTPTTATTDRPDTTVPTPTVPTPTVPTPTVPTRPSDTDRPDDDRPDDDRDRDDRP